MTACRIVERAFDPSLGNVGRGEVIPWDEFMAMTAIPGYEPYVPPGSDIRLGVQVYSSGGTQSSRRWKGFTRHDAATGVHYVVGFESDVSKEHK